MKTPSNSTLMALDETKNLSYKLLSRSCTATYYSCKILQKITNLVSLLQLMNSFNNLVRFFQETQREQELVQDSQSMQEISQD